MTLRRVEIKWTQTAADALRRLPEKARRGLLRKADDLKNCDPKSAGKPLTGPLKGCYRITWGRYRAIYSVSERQEPNGEKVIEVTVTFVLAGLRKNGDKADVYALAHKLVHWGILRLEPSPRPESAPPPAPTSKKPKSPRKGTR